MPYHLIIVDGNTDSRSDLVKQLQPEFAVEACALAREALERLQAHSPDLLLLDLGVPDMEGLTFLQVLRDTEHGKELPVIVLSARRTEAEVIQAFELGIEDYLVKPADPRELIVRIRTVLRRNIERTDHWGSALRLSGIEIDPSQRRCLVNGRRVVLRPREFELLEILMRKAGRVLRRVYLLETVWGMSSVADTRAVDVMVSRLRRHLGKRAGRLIETVSKLGYSFRKR